MACTKISLGSHIHAFPVLTHVPERVKSEYKPGKHAKCVRLISNGNSYHKNQVIGWDEDNYPIAQKWSTQLTKKIIKIIMRIETVEPRSTNNKSINN